MSLSYIGNDEVYVTVPIGVDVFKTKGPGMNYVHGGFSLEEVIVPILEISSKKGAKNQRPVELQLVRSDNKITNQGTFSLLNSLQKNENIRKIGLEGNPVETVIKQQIYILLNEKLNMNLNKNV